jgi:hypothetical protein
MREIPYNHEPGKLPATLEKIPIFSRLEESSLDGILGHCSLVEFAAGLELFGLRDTARDRRRFIESIDGRIVEWSGNKYESVLGVNSHRLPESSTAERFRFYWEDPRTPSTVAVSLSVLCDARSRKLSQVPLPDLSPTEAANSGFQIRFHHQEFFPAL